MYVCVWARTTTWSESRVLMMGTGCGGDYEITFYNRSAREFLIKLSRDNTHAAPIIQKGCDNKTWPIYNNIYVHATRACALILLYFN